MLRSILVPLDGSPLAAGALPFAQAIAVRTDAKLVLATVAHAHVLPGGDAAAAALHAIEQGQSHLEKSAEAIRRHGYLVEAHTYFGEPAPALIAAARDLRVDLIVMSTHDHAGLGGWLHRGVADQVMRTSDVPVLLVPAEAPEPWPADGPRRVLLPLDGSTFGEEAIEPAGELACALDASLVLTQVVEPPPVQVSSAEGIWPYGSEMSAAALYAEPIDWNPQRELDAAGDYLRRVSARLDRAVGAVVVEIGDPATTIATVAREHGVHAIAMATHGRSGLERLLLGGTATKVLHEAHVPVLMVRPEALRQAEPSPPVPPAKAA